MGVAGLLVFRREQDEITAGIKRHVAGARQHRADQRGVSPGGDIDLIGNDRGTTDRQEMRSLTDRIFCCGEGPKTESQQPYLEKRFQIKAFTAP